MIRWALILLLAIGLPLGTAEPRSPSSLGAIVLDHILPRAVVPELAARHYNLEALLTAVNLEKSAKITTREVSVARGWYQKGLLSQHSLAAVEAGL
jgi:hypothetical protein